MRSELRTKEPVTSVSEEKVEERTLADLIEDFDKAKGKLAILSFEKEATERITYAELQKRVLKLSAGLASIGVKKGDGVMLMAANSSSWICAYLAVVYSGAVALPVDGQQGDDVIKHIIADSTPKCVFTDEVGNKTLHRLFHRKPFRVFRLDLGAEEKKSWQQLLLDEKLKDPDLSPDDLACIFYTSGTTGMPKGVPLTHGNVIMQLDAAIAKSKLLNKKDRVLLPLPLYHVYPLNMGLLGSLRMGVPVILPQALSGPELMRALKLGKATVLVAVPRLLRALINGVESKVSKNKAKEIVYKSLLALSQLVDSLSGFSPGKSFFLPVHKEISSSLRLLCSGGAPLEEDLCRKLRALGWRLAVGYGLTETAPLLTLRLPENNNAKSVGKPIANVELRITHKEKGETESREGEIEARGPNVFSGYLNLPDKTAEAFTEDGWFRTGDLGYLNEHGELFIEGRSSSLIVTEGGKKFQPEDLEKVYAESPIIREIGVLQSSNKLVALILADKSGEKKDLHQEVAKAVDAVSSRLPSYKRIRGFELTNSPLPKTNLGKLKRKELEEVYKESKSAGKKGRKVDFEAQLTADDRQLLDNAISAQVLSYLQERFPEEQITPDTSPSLDLNVDSFEWLNLSLEIMENTGVELDDEAIAQIGTVRDLLKLVVEKSEEGGKKEVSPLSQPGKYLSPEQKHWLEPLNKFETALSRSIYNLNFFLMKTFFHSSAIGDENLEKNKQLIFIPNHASYLDIFALCSCLPFERLQKTQVAAWTGIAFHNPFNTFMSRLVQAFPIEAKKSLISSLALAAAVLKKGKSMIWFPEGERTLDGKLLAFRPGIGILLENVDVDVVPVYLEGTREALPPGAFFPKFRKITVHFGQAISSTELQKKGKGKSPAEMIANALHDEVNALKRKAGKRN